MQIGVDATCAVENRRIFVVEPDPVVRAALSFILQDENETHEVAEPAQLRARQWPGKPDLILLGLSCFREQGGQLLQELRESFPGARILLVAALGEMQLAREGLRQGADDVLYTPVRVETVRAKVNLLLGRIRLPGCLTGGSAGGGGEGGIDGTGGTGRPG